jgi:hypothetical protein
MALSAPGRPAAKAGFRPTEEQQTIIDAYLEGRPLVVEALAGTGKTTTLKSIAAATPQRTGTYLAFNKAIVTEAEGSFPGRVNVTTAHALAYKAVGHAYGHRLPGNPGQTRMSAQRMAGILRVKPADVGGAMINPVILTRLAQGTVSRFIKSPDREIGAHHLPGRLPMALAAADIEAWALASLVLPIARRIWADQQSTNGRFTFTHDHYLKIWQLSNPVLPTDYIMFDEAQDADPVIASIVDRQACQRIYVGDQNQAIYGWRGAVDAMGQVRNATRLPLTRSFRFGPAVAELANEWLYALGSPLRVVGHDPILSRIEKLDAARAILCRTNGTALGWVIAFQERGVKVALAPGDRSAGKDISQFAWAARDLMAGKGTDHPDLAMFESWDQLLAFIDEEEDTADLKRLVNIINRVGVNAVINAIKNLTPEASAEVTVSTAHKAKGLEWDSVRVADDFAPPEYDDPDDRPTEEELAADRMLAYVTVTRAKLQLDPGALAEPILWR